MADRPNILFILSDQQRWDTVSCYGEPLGADLNLTPHLDRLAAEGVRFESTFTMQPVCGPARSCLQTGVYATESGCFTNGRALRPDQTTMAKLLNAAGYQTAYIGKWHLASGPENNYRIRPVPLERRGGYTDYWLAADTLEFTSHGYEGFMFDRDGNRVDFEGYRVDCITNFVIDYLRDYATASADRPFFLFVSFIEPHQQNDLDRFVGPIGSKQRFKNYTVPGDLLGTEPRPNRRCDWPRHMPDYLGCCWSLDQNFGRIRAQLELLDLADDTLILYTSDHGNHFCTRNSEYKRCCHDSAIRVPLIVRGPGFNGAHLVNDLVSLIDLPPTVLRAAGADIPGPMRGRPLQGLIDGSARDDWRHEVFIQISEAQVGRAIRTRKWKYGVDAPHKAGVSDSASDRYVEQYLYDLQADPHERNNLVSDPSLVEIRIELATTLKRRMVEAGEDQPLIEPAGTPC